MLVNNTQFMAYQGVKAKDLTNADVAGAFLGIGAQTGHGYVKTDAGPVQVDPATIAGL